MKQTNTSTHSLLLIINPTSPSTLVSNSSFISSFFTTHTFLSKMDSFHSYGDWDFSYLEPVKSKRIQLLGDKEVDLFEVEAPTIIRAGSNSHNRQRKKGRADKEQGKKQGRVCYVTCRTPKAVDEDLYKIPPELLYRIPKRKRVLGNFLTGCLGLTCIA